MKLNFIDKFLGSGFYFGYFSYASGTASSFAALLIFYIPGFENPYIIIPITFVLFIYGIYVSGKFEQVYGKDPAQCTIDEVVGTWISFIYLPKSIGVILTAFFIWRIFDIIKPQPAKAAEKAKGGLGVMLDDLVSGIYTLVIMHVLVYLVGKF